ncbi:pilus assembly protein TadG-related protein [Brevibacterium litoralis]|uniref:pilus assembly protein TadG-related protein n=1 Tax=Brevibacterium litoralis TaxID=3138935 RepID=UPI0032ECCD02
MRRGTGCRAGRFAVGRFAGRPGGRRDRGAISPIVPILSIVILLLGGLVIDAGRQLDLRARAIAYAQEAARAGAAQIDLRQPGLVLRPMKVRQEVENYCGVVMSTDTSIDDCRFTGISDDPADDTDEQVVVSVEVEMSVGASLLRMIGVTELAASGTGSARPYQGVREAGDDPAPS